MTSPAFVRKPEQVWLLWKKSEALKVRPSELLGLTEDDYTAYCVDEAVVYFGFTLDNMLEEAGHKPSKEEKAAQAKRQRVLDIVFADAKAKDSTPFFSDPAMMFL